MKAGMIALALVIAGPAAAFEDIDGTFRKLGENEQRISLELIDLALPDGQSVRFRRVYKSSSDRICGYINARNLSGAYAGYRKFYLDVPSKRLVIEITEPDRRRSEHAELENGFINSLCQFKEWGL